VKTSKKEITHIRYSERSGSVSAEIIVTSKLLFEKLGEFRVVGDVVNGTVAGKVVGWSF